MTAPTVQGRRAASQSCDALFSASVGVTTIIPSLYDSQLLSTLMNSPLDHGSIADTSIDRLGLDEPSP
jgi:hypothetical protein